MDYSNFVYELNNTNYGHVIIKVKNMPEIKGYEDFLESVTYVISVFSKALIKSKQNLNDAFFDCTIDLEDAQLKNYNKDFCDCLSKNMKEAFPEKLRTCYIINPSKIVKTFYSLIKLFMDEPTQKKVRFIKDPLTS